MGKKSAKPKWLDIKKQIQDWTPKEQLELIKHLFELSSENKQFLTARAFGSESSLDVMEGYRDRIHAAFYEDSGYPRVKFGLGEARRAIREYKKATDDLPGTLSLTLEYVETGAELTQQFGSIDALFYDSLCSALSDVRKLLKGKGTAYYPQFQERLSNLAKLTDGMGWGFGDYIGDVVAELEQTHKRSV